MYDPSHKLILLRLTLCSLLAGCGFADYEAAPLEPERLLDELARARAVDAPTDAITLAHARDWLRDRGPAVREALAAFETATARAEVSTPLANPAISLGPILGLGTAGSPDVVPYGTFSWSIPWTDRRARRDEVERSRAELARIEVLATLHEVWTEVRREFAALTIADLRLAVADDAVDAASRSVGLLERLVAAGQATAADTAQFELEHARSEAQRIEDELTRTRLAASLATHTGVATSHFRLTSADALPNTPENAPSLDDLRGGIADRHPQLLRLRAAYEASDRTLRLEIIQQYPDLQLLPQFQGEVSESFDLLTLAVGMNLPLFDRNQRAIATAAAHRDEMRTRFKAESARVLAALERARADVAITTRRHRLFEQRILPLAEQGVEIAARAVRAGTGGVLRYLDAARSLRRARRDAFEAQLDALDAWSRLERASGARFLEFPGGGGEDPTPPSPIEPGGSR